MTDMKNYEDLSDAEKALRSLIYAVETKDRKHPNHPIHLGEEYLSVKLAHAKEVANKLGIPLIEVEF